MIDLIDLPERLRAFARDCVLHGDMTPMAQRMLDRILDEVASRRRSTCRDRSPTPADWRM